MSDDVRKIAAWVPMTSEMVKDAEASRSMVDELFDRWANPWKYPDSAPLPAFDLFPRLTRLATWAKSIRNRNDESEAW